ncbi:MAG: ABC transporter permease [Cyclobacteriaceae bacterium]|nr:ABC transporter permease [Cyclobacteriaceae bacterium]
MIKNYFKFLIRVLNKNKTHTIINITGLSIGISTCLVIFLLVHHELSFDKHIPNRENIYRIYTEFNGTFTGTNRGVAIGVHQFFQENFTQHGLVAETHTYGTQVKLRPGKQTEKFKLENGIAFVDSNFFQLFPKKWLAGNITDLNNPYKAILTEKSAQLLFGLLSPEQYLNKEFVIKDSVLFSVAGIVANEQQNSDFDFACYLSAPSMAQKEFKENYTRDDWQSTNSGEVLMIKLHQNKNLSDLQKVIEAANKRYNEVNTDKGWKVSYKEQPLSDIHFNGDLGIFDHINNTAHKPSLYILCGVAFLILLLAAINFINLETAQSVKRAKEIGIRKVLGSSRFQLIIHFLFQSILLTTISAIIAVPLAEVSILLFKDFLPSGLIIQFTSPALWLILLGLILLIGLIAGAYPAFIMTDFKPATALKNISIIDKTNSRSQYMRKVLITFQFGFAQILIIGTLVLVAQIDFVLKKDMGFNAESVIHMYTPYEEPIHKVQTFKNEIEKIPAIKKLSLNNAAPAENGFSSNTLKFKNKGNEEIEVNAFRKFGDENYLDLYNIQLLKGRYANPSDTLTEIVINEQLAKEFGLDIHEAIGQFVNVNDNIVPIVGVVKDFNISSLKTKVSPVYMAYEKSNFAELSVKLNYDNNNRELEENLKKIEMAWKKVYPDYPFEYQFVNETIENFYKRERQITKLASAAVVLSIVISCLGLFGLISLAAIQRTKEIGIRKTLGASVNQIVLLLANDFLLLVLISFILASPVAWYVSDYILQDFEYKIDTPWFAYLLTLVASLVIAFMTLSFQAVKAARVNPADSLKSE